MLGNDELFKLLLKQMKWSPDSAAFQAGGIEKVLVYRQQCAYFFHFTFPEILPAALYQEFTKRLKETFQGIARVDFSLTITQSKTWQPKLVLDYWPLVTGQLDIHNGFAKQVLMGQLPTVEDEKLVIRTDHQQLQAFIADNYLHKIKEAYQKLGFPQLPFTVLVDEETANDRRDQFAHRKKMLEEKQQDIAREADEKQEKSSPKTEPEALKIGGNINPQGVQSMNNIQDEEKNVALEGHIFDLEIRELNSGRKILTLKITDYTSAFQVTMFSNTDHDELVFEQLNTGMWVRVAGDIRYDERYARDYVLMARQLEAIEKMPRLDTAPADEKRIELHAHSNMSTMDATNTVSELIERAKLWGHEAIAITDHAGVQAFPEASHAGHEQGIKIIYGLEANVVEDNVPITYQPTQENIFDATYVVFDVETTGLSAEYHHIIELAAVKMEKGNVIDTFEEFINPGHPLSAFTTELTGITDAMLTDARPEEDIMADFTAWCQDCVLVAHNATFDMGFINAANKRYGLPPYANPVVDTLELSRFLHPNLKSHRLNTLAKRYDVNLEQHHRAIYDAESTSALAWIFLNEAYNDHQIETLAALNQGSGNEEAYKHSRPFQATILVRNQAGLKDLFKLVSEANTKYFYRVPRVPRSRLDAYRKNFLVGTGCGHSEFFEALLQKGFEEAKNVASYYDYLEIHPKEVYQSFVDSGQIPDQETLRKMMVQMVEIAKALNIPALATGDVHYLDPHDKIYRDIVVKADRHNQRKHLPEAHFRTTEEMLASYHFLGEEEAYQLVVTGPKELVAQIEEVEPLKTKLYTPTIEGAEEEIRETSYSEAKRIYGEDLPSLITERLEKELTSIIGNGFAVVYLISEKLVKKSNSDGYIVGSRGSVGSSFVATMLGITEVNPLAPHYVCPNCHYSEFFTNGEVGSGFDLADKACPKCGEALNKDGHDIPFETFLGFTGDKVPDIDLNFSGDYQPTAHQFTKEMFGEDHVYRAGTISTVATKTAFGYVLGYAEDEGIQLRQAEKEFLAVGTSGVKRTTGQHPGGIIVIPENMDVYDFTPVQYPADAQDSEWLTTHFDFHSIDENVLKLDILGHDDPTVIRKLQDLSGMLPEDIPMDDPDVYQLFNGTEILGVSPKQLLSKIGTLGIPEFGTPFTRQMLEATHPTTFAELVQISGLSHGSGVWVGNAEVLVREKNMPLSEVIGCRDDIMVYLIHQGLKEADAFHIMEKVRKGRGLSEEHQQIMRENNIPEWYLDSCLKIEYMFPKAHATAYVINALRVAWFKVHRPIWYYAAYLSVRANDFDLTAMTSGCAGNKNRLKEIKAKGNEASDTEKNLLIVLEIINELWERGYRLKMVDLLKSDATDFVIEDEKTLIAPFRAIPGLGINVAKQIVKAREESPFLSKEDLRNRGRVSKTIVEYMDNHQVLEDLPDENQLSLF